MPPPDSLPCVLYAAKSTEDRHGSIPTQLDDCRAFAEREGLTVVAEFQDEGFSAYSGNRGPGLAGAKRALAEHAPCVLVVQHTDRLARGAGDEPGAADHLMELFFGLRRQGIDLWTVQSGKIDRLRALLEGERNTEDSKRKSAAVRSGKRRAFERGQWPGGPVPDGYVALRSFGPRGEPVTTLEEDPDRARTVREAFELAAARHGDPTIARRLNRAGHRTKAGGPFTRRRVQDLLTNPAYAGRVVKSRGKPEMEVRPGLHPALIDPEAFERVQNLRAVRDRGGRPKGGRPTARYVLSKLAECARCGSRMYCVTSPYVRRDCSSARSYVCAQVHGQTGTCDAPKIDARDLDAGIVDKLPNLLLDFEGWLAHAVSGQAEERQGLEREIATQIDALQDLDRMIPKLEAQWVRFTADEAPDRADAAMAVLTDKRTERDSTEAAIVALEGHLTEARKPTPDDAMLDFLLDLERAVSGPLDAAQTVQEVNEVFRAQFARVTLDTLAGSVRAAVDFKPEITERAYSSGLVLRPPGSCENRVSMISLDGKWLSTTWASLEKTGSHAQA